MKVPVTVVSLYITPLFGVSTSSSEWESEWGDCGQERETRNTIYVRVKVVRILEALMAYQAAGDGGVNVDHVAVRC